MKTDNIYCLLRAIACAFFCLVLAACAATDQRSMKDADIVPDNPAACYEKALRLYKARKNEADEKRIFVLFETAASAGHAKAQEAMGDFTMQGIACQPNHIRAREWYEKAAKGGELDAMVNAAFMELHAIGGPKEVASAIKWMETAAERGHSESQVTLMKMYGLGKGVEIDHEKALRWAKVAAARGSGEAKGTLAIAHAAGLGGFRTNLQVAVALLEEAARDGDALCQVDLGEFYVHGRGVLKNPARALDLFRRAATNCHAVAFLDLGKCYHSGTAVPSDNVEAFKWYSLAIMFGDDKAGAQAEMLKPLLSNEDFAEAERRVVAFLRKAAQDGKASAQFYLASKLSNAQGTAVEQADVFKWVFKSAAQEYPPALCELGLLHLRGLGCPTNVQKAITYYRLAAYKAHATAANNLAVFYSEGKFVPKDPELEMAWLVQAAEGGSASAQAWLGDRYGRGDGVPKDAKTMVRFLKLAAEQGDAAAQTKLGAAYIDGLGVPRDITEGLIWLRKAARSNFAHAQYALGVFYDAGAIFPADKVEARMWFYLAAQNGNKEAAAKDALLAATLSREENEKALRAARERMQKQQ